MPIQSKDIKLLASERLTDNEDGGGRITGNEITDGQSNNLFPDISDLDRTYGDVSLRKAYVGVRTDDTDSYFGGHIIVDEMPEDDNVAVSMFTTKDWTDFRDDARARIEAYVVAGAVSPMNLLGDQLPGQRQIRVYQQLDRPVPDIGEVLLLSTEEGASTGEQQFIRILDTDESVLTFTDDSGDFKRRVIVISISDTLNFRFYGQEASRLTSARPDTLVRTTNVADASRYYATTKLRDPAALQDASIRVDSVFTPVVPASRSEQPFIDIAAAGNLSQVIEVGDEITETVEVNGVADQITLMRPPVPGTLTFNGWTETDDGELVSGAGVVHATVIHDERRIIFAQDPAIAGTTTATYVPGAQIAGASFTTEAEVKLANRQYNYVFNLSPLPYQGTVTVDYRAQGRWYTLYDNIAGDLVADVDGLGAGQVDRSTGSLLVTLGALPDVGSSVIVKWGTQQQFERIGTGTSQASKLYRRLPDYPYSTASGSVTWADKQATLAYGFLSGDANGRIDTHGNVTLDPEVYPAPGTVFTFTLNTLTQTTEVVADPLGEQSGSISGTLAAAPVEPGTFVWVHVGRGDEEPTDPGPGYTYYPETRYTQFTVRDDGAGQLESYADDTLLGVIGTIDYSTGDYSFSLPTRTVNTHLRTEDSDGDKSLSYDRARVVFGIDSEAKATTTYVAEADAGGVVTETEAITEIKVRAFRGYTTPVANTLLFDFNGRAYYDLNGTLYSDYDSVTGQGLQAGTIDYLNGTATITDWDVGPGALTLIAGVVKLARPLQSSVVFRTESAPLSPGSTGVRATANTGDEYNETADQNGEFGETPGGISGVVDQELGIVRLTFEQPVFPESVIYNTVAFKYLPLDPAILGLDPVRLPQDGRVAAFKPADVVVVHHTARDEYSTITDGQTLDAGRTRLASVRIEDSTGAEVPPTDYTADLDAGTVTLTAAPTGTAPYTLIHRVEDMQVVTDVQINGYLDFAGQLSHDYPAGETLVSSALVTGDLQARYTNLFEQNTWTGEFASEQIGDAPDAAYNATAYPIEVTNRGALTERWAIIFTGSTAFRIVGENIGQIATGSTATETAPQNPNTGVPYFRIDPLGWGQGWSTGNVLRFDTIGADYPIWTARTILQGPAQAERDDFRIQIRGNANRD